MLIKKKIKKRGRNFPLFKKNKTNFPLHLAERKKRATRMVFFEKQNLPRNVDHQPKKKKNFFPNPLIR